MNRRIALAVGGLSVLLVLVIGIPVTFIFRDAETYHLRLGLQRDALVLAGDLAALPQSDWGTRLSNYQETTGARVVVVNSAGEIVVDTSGSPTGSPFSRAELDAALAGTVTGGVRESSTLGQPLTYAAVPIRQGALVVGALRLTMPESTVDEKVGPLQWALVWLLVLVVVVALVVSWLVAKALSRPLDRLAESARNVGEDPSERVGAVRGPPEVQAVAEALDDTARRLTLAMARSRAVAEEASHHLRTPLGALRLRVEAISDLTDGEVHDEAESALDEIDRLNRRIEQILTMSRGANVDAWQVIDVAAAAQARSTHATQLAATADKRINLEIPGGAGAILAPPGTVERSLDELVANAVKYAEGEVTVTVGSDSGTVWLEVCDDGPGIPAVEREMVFDRFVRGSGAVAGGAGLGLAMLRDSAREIGGDAWVVEGGAGATIHVEWPRYEAESHLS